MKLLTSRLTRALLPRRHTAAALLSGTRTLQGEFSDVLRFDTIHPGTPLATQEFAKRVLLVVNTASQCTTHSGQLRRLQELHERLHERGLVVLAVPSNDFGNHEPGDNLAIRDRYLSPEQEAITFPITTKSIVIGDQAHPFFKRIVTEYSRSVAPTWNFDKFLLDHRGDLRAVFPHDTDPLVPEVLEAIEELLEELTDADNEAEDEDEYDEEDEDDEEEDEEDDEGKKSSPPTR